MWLVGKLFGGVMEECDDCEYQEDYEQDFCDICCGIGNVVKIEYGGNDGNDQENQSVMQYGGIFVGKWWNWLGGDWCLFIYLQGVFC